ncbi:MAG: hypothetical protein CVV27_03655 [Candidatus Melainabacteria bacterium HGW-Melainabacteria-1]|nr:MAG: hypothetical protein CVV27_03655 [Candidatus Melainabacteria bacterium HGW-Melainabacteria-1]
MWLLTAQLSLFMADRDLEPALSQAYVIVSAMSQQRDDSSPNTPDPADILQQARALRGSKQYDACIAVVVSALAMLPDPALIAELRLELGSSLLAAGRWAEAREQLSLCLDTERPASGTLYHRLGRAHQELGELAAAESFYRQAIAAKAGKQAAKSWHQLGRVSEQQGNSKQALAAYSEAIAAFGASGQALEQGIAAFQCGRLQQSLKQWDAAQSAFETARSLLASDASLRAEACYALGELAIRRQALAEANDLLTEALSIHRHLKQQAGIGMSLLKLCQVQMLQRDWKAVLLSVRQAIEALEQSKETAALQLAYELQGELLQMLGKADEAEPWLARARELNLRSDSV